MQRLLLVRHAPTDETRRAAFPATSGHVRRDGCAGLDRAGRAAAAALGAAVGGADRVWSSAARRCEETAAAAGWPVDEVVADLAECDFGAWAGRTPAEVHEVDPDGLARWYADPDTAPHGGEGFAAVRARTRRVLAAARPLPGTTIAVTSGGVVKAALLEALDLPTAALWRLDVAPASVTELHPDSAGGWRVARVAWTPWWDAPAAGEAAP